MDDELDVIQNIHCFLLDIRREIVGWSGSHCNLARMFWSKLVTSHFQFIYLPFILLRMGLIYTRLTPPF